MKVKVRRFTVLLMVLVLLAQMTPSALAITLLSNSVGGTTYHNVDFKAGERIVVSQMVADGGHLDFPEAPSLMGSKFIGWADDRGAMYVTSPPSLYQSQC